METAIHADASVLKSFETLKKKPQINHQKTDADNIKLLSGDNGFKALQSVIDKQIESLMEMKLSGGESLESVGFRFLACQVAIEQLRYVRNLPDALRQSEHERETRTA